MAAFFGRPRAHRSCWLLLVAVLLMRFTNSLRMFVTRMKEVGGAKVNQRQIIQTLSPVSSNYCSSIIDSLCQRATLGMYKTQIRALPTQCHPVVNTFAWSQVQIGQRSWMSLARRFRPHAESNSCGWSWFLYIWEFVELNWIEVNSSIKKVNLGFIFIGGIKGYNYRCQDSSTSFIPSWTHVAASRSKTWKSLATSAIILGIWYSFTTIAIPNTLTYIMTMTLVLTATATQ